MKLTQRVLVLLAVFALGNLAAATITLGTDGYFFDNDNPQSSGGLGIGTALVFGLGSHYSISFTGIGSPTSVDLTLPTNTSLGMFITSAPVDLRQDNLPAGAGFVLNVYVPGPAGSGPYTSSVAHLTGALTYTQSELKANFDPADFTLVGAQFVLAQPPGGFRLVPPSALDGQTTIEAEVTSVPEPGAAGLVGVALMGFSFLLKRVRR